MSFDDDDLYGDLEGDDGLDLYGGLVEETRVTKDQQPTTLPSKSSDNSMPVTNLPHKQTSQQQQQQQLPQQLDTPASQQQSKPTESGKIFVGGLNWETSESTLLSYFEKYGEVIDSVIMRDTLTGKSRGFGFITFADGKLVEGVLSIAHTIDGKLVDPKRAVPKGDQDKCEKIFVGGISPDVTESEFSDFFSQFGGVIDSILMLDRDTGRPRGFGFITFEHTDCVDRVLDRQGSLFIKDKLVEVKRAQPKGAPGLAPTPRPSNLGGYNNNGMQQQGRGMPGNMMQNMGGMGNMMPNMMMMPPQMYMGGGMQQSQGGGGDADGGQGQGMFGYYNPAMVRPTVPMMGYGGMPMMGGGGFGGGFQRGAFQQQRGAYGGGGYGRPPRGGFGGGFGGYQQGGGFGGQQGGDDQSGRGGKRHHPYKGGR